MAEREGGGVKCWACGATAPAGDRCPGCGRLQAFPAGSDHWTVLGLDRRLDLDRGRVERRVHVLNRRFHPDYFRLHTAEEQAISLENSAAVNTAYRALRDPVARVEYLLDLEGLGLGTAGQTRPPADLFEEILEIQEARMALPGADASEAAELRTRLEGARAEFEGRRERTEADLTARFAAWDAGDVASRGRLLTEMRDVLATRAYLRTVLRDLDAALTVSTVED